MIKKIGGFLEEHVEKIILIIVGLLCSWLLITRVLLTPNVIEYESKKYSPANLDEQILADIRAALNQSPTAPGLILPDQRNYAELFANPLGNVDFDFHPKPEKSDTLKTQNDYPEPDINKIKITNVNIEYIRSVAYEPIEEITVNNLYDDTISEANDLDFVSVSANIDIKSIVDEFKKCYNTGAIADPCKAKPIFAQVNLQRQRLLLSGQWSDWENVPRTKIDYNRNLFKYTDNYSDLPFGYEIYKYQLNQTITQLELLQPIPYQIATANEEWLPPELYRDFKEAQKKDERAARKIESSSSSTTTSTSSTGSRRSRNNTGGDTSTTTTGTRRGSSRRSNTSLDNTNTNTNTRRGGRGTTTQTDTTANTDSDSEKLFVEEVYDEYESVILTAADDLTKMSDPILFWAHDDTVQPKNTYRYRVRVGLLNPTASSEDDELVFWSNFSDVTDQINIPGKIYFFAGEVQEAAKTVSVSVYKLHLGYWYKKVFDRVGQGEMIGSIAEIESKEPEETTTIGKTTDTDEDEKEMIAVDFTTGAVMFDIERVSEVTGGSSLSNVPYDNMLYTYDGKEILKMPATRTPNQKIWPKDLYDAYVKVQGLINDKYEELKSWGSNQLDLEQIRRGETYERRGNR